MEGVSAYDAKRPGEQGRPLQRPSDLAHGLLVVALGEQQGGETAGYETERDMALDRLSRTHLVMSPPKTLLQLAVGDLDGEAHGVALDNLNRRQRDVGAEQHRPLVAGQVNGDPSADGRPSRPKRRGTASRLL